MDTWTRTPADEQAVAEGCRFDLAAAERVRRFFRSFLRHSKGEFAGKPFDLLDWQWEGVIAPLFGWKRADGTRRFRRAYISMAKKNGKSTLCAGISLYLLVGDGEPGAEVYGAAADRDQAGIVYGEAAAMVQASPALTSRVDIIRTTKRLVFRSTGSWFRALSAEAPTKEGLNIHGLIFDELHAQKTRVLWDTLTYGGAARRQPLLIAITTAGSDRESICFEQYTYARGVLEGRIHDTGFFAYLAEAGPEDDWKAADTWERANPSYGITVKPEQMQADCLEAQNSPAKENSFRRYRLNQWTDSATRWLSSERWDACDRPVMMETTDECYVGLDLSSTLDTTSLVLLFPHQHDETYSVLPFFWVPESACKERERKNKTRFDEWIRRGHMIRTPGDVVDYQAIREKLKVLAGLFDVRGVYVDPWNATALATQLAEEDGFKIEYVRQGYASLSEPAKKLEELVLGRRLRHGGHPVLRWQVGNCSVETDSAGNIKPSKKVSTEKIDGVVSLVMALAGALVAPVPGNPEIHWI